MVGTNRLANTSVCNGSFGPAKDEVQIRALPIPPLPHYRTGTAWRTATLAHGALISPPIDANVWILGLIADRNPALSIRRSSSYTGRLALDLCSGVAMDWITTSTIIDQLRDFENRGAWGRFTDRFRTPLISFAVRMGIKPSDAEDVAQDTLLAFAEAYRNGKYDPAKGRLRDWLFGIAFRQLGDMRRRLAKHENRTAAAEATSFFANLPDEREATKSWNEEWARAVLCDCLDQTRREMEATTVQAFELFALAKQPAAEVAEQLGMTRNAVFIAKHRVLKRLRELQETYERVS